MDRAMIWEDAPGVLGDALASAEPTPGGGAAAGTAAVMGCALGEMAAGISARGKRVSEADRSALASAAESLKGLRARLAALVGEDAAAFGAVMEAYALPKGDSGKAERLRSSLLLAAEVPLETARTASAALKAVAGAAPKASAMVASDMNCAIHLLRAGILCAFENVEINLSLLKDDAAAAPMRDRMEELRAEME